MGSVYTDESTETSDNICTVWEVWAMRHPTWLIPTPQLSRCLLTSRWDIPGCSIGLMDSVLLGYNGLFILSLSWTSFFSQKRQLLFAKKAMWYYSFIDFIQGPHFTLNEPSLLPTVLTLQVIFRKTTLTSRYRLYYCILASSLFFSLSCHTLISKIILYHF